MSQNVNDNLQALMNSLERFVTSKTVVGEPIHIDQTILVPLVDVSFGAGTAATESTKFIERRKEHEKKVDGAEGIGAGGLGAKITPSAVLVIQNGTTQLINIRAQDGLTKIIDMIPGIVSKVPDFMSRFTKGETTHTEDKTSEKQDEV